MREVICEIKLYSAVLFVIGIVYAAAVFPYEDAPTSLPPPNLASNWNDQNCEPHDDDDAADVLVTLDLD